MNGFDFLDMSGILYLLVIACTSANILVLSMWWACIGSASTFYKWVLSLLIAIDIVFILSMGVRIQICLGDKDHAMSILSSWPWALRTVPLLALLIVLLGWSIKRIWNAKCAEQVRGFTEGKK